jgi:hypothetical protein
LMGSSVSPTETTVGESATLTSLRTQLTEEKAANALQDKTDLAQLLATQLGDLSLAKDESILSLITTMGIDLISVSTALGLDIEQVVTTLGLEFKSLDDNLGLSIPEIATALGTDLAGLAKTLGVDIGTLGTSLDINLTDVASAFGLDMGELAKALGVDFTSLLTANKTGLDSVTSAVDALDLNVKIDLPEILVTVPPQTEYINIPGGATGNWDFTGLDGLGGYDWSYAGLPTFAKGGISSTASIFGEAGPEAAVPLPDGRSIPVTFTNNTANAALIEAVRLLREEIVTLRNESLDIADGAAVQREEQRQSVLKSSDRTINAMKVPIDTRRIA